MEPVMMAKARRKEGTSVPASTRYLPSSPSLFSQKCDRKLTSTRWDQRYRLVAALPQPGTKWGTAALLFTEKSQR